MIPSTIHKLRESLQVPFRLSLLMLLLVLVQYSFQVDLGILGIRPLKIAHIFGIFTAPLIHGNFAHFIANIPPFIILGTALYYFYGRIANQVMVYAYFIPYIIVWFIGRPYFHIGSSGMVYALAFFIISIGLFRGSLKGIVLAAITIFLYGSLIYGVLPTERKISWETHLAGAVIGVVVGFAYSTKKKVN
jgi:membrane associated rhomboid family serine protease